MEPFKNLLNPKLVNAAARQLQKQQPDFDAAGFTRCATQGLEALEMKARALHIGAALATHLPQPFARAADLLQSALAPPMPGEKMPEPDGLASGLKGWILWPVGEFVAQAGLISKADASRSLQLLHAITQRFTAEWAIRPFIERYPALTFATLQRWCGDDSAHVRRLVSEGSRPRLPWGRRLQSLVQDPSPTLPLLRALQDDPSAYVRRSVANHLGDIAKDHPDLLLAWLAKELPDAPPQRLALLRHASRSLIKAGHPAVLQAFGLGRAFKGQAQLSVLPARLALGESLSLRLELQSSSPKPQSLELDLVLHLVKAHGGTSPKVFKGWKLQIEPRQTLVLQKKLPIRPVTTRRYHAGWHLIQVQANGRVVAEGGFELSL